MKEAAISRISSALLLLRPTFLRQHKAYTRTDFQGDMVAGISVAVVQIPQAMAFALIAGLPAVYGLYASLFGCIASLWGSSRQLSTGPVAMVSLLTFTSLVSLAPPGSEHFIRLAATLALLTGLIYLLLGFFRFGSMIHLVPHSVIAGFSSAAAVLIVISQIPTLLGISLPSSEIVLRNILNLVQTLPHLSPIATALGIGALVILVLFRRLPHSFPSALIVLLLAILAGYGLRLDLHGVAIIGEIPSGLPHLVLPFIGVNSLALLLPKAAVLALVAFVATHANTATLARSTRERQDTDQELVGQGLANVVASFFQGYPISGSFTRSAINREAGARTSFSSVVSTGVTLATILFLTPLFFYLPLTALAAIVILSAVSLIDIRRIREMYAISRSDGLVALFTFCMVFVMKPEDALFTGMVVALLVFIRQMVWGSHVSEVGIDVEKRVLLSTIQNDQVRIFPGVVIVRVGVSLYYANTDQALTQVDGIIASHTHQGDQVKNLVLDMSGVNFVDISGMEILEEYIEKWEQQHMRISMIYVREQVFEILKNTSYFGHRNIFYNISELRTQLQLI